MPDWLKYNFFETLCGKWLGLQQWEDPNRRDIGRSGKATASSTKQAAVASPQPTPEASEIKSRFSQCPRLSELSAKSTFWTDIYTLNNPPWLRNPLTLDLPIAHLLKKFQDADPLPEPKLGLPMSTIKRSPRKTPFLNTIFHLLWEWEYTTPSP